MTLNRNVVQIQDTSNNMSGKYEGTNVKSTLSISAQNKFYQNSLEKTSTKVAHESERPGFLM